MAQDQKKGTFFGNLLRGISGGLPGLLLNAGSSLIGNIFKKKEQRRADRQNIEFWNMQNMYNHPMQQMARLKEAGLNPNLIYGSGVSGATGLAGSVSPSKASPVQFSDPTQAVIGTTLLDAQKRNVEANTNKTEEDTQNTKWQNYILRKSKDSQVELQRYRAEKEKQEVINKEFQNLEIEQSWQKRVEILSELVIQNKSQTALKQLDEYFANKAKLRPSDPWYLRGLTNLWNLLTNWADPSWINKEIKDLTKNNNNYKENQ